VVNQVLLLGRAAGPAGGDRDGAVRTSLVLLAAASACPLVLTGGFTGLIPPLVPEPHLRRAYGAEATSYNLAGVVGPALAGTLAAVTSASVAVAASAALSALALAAVLRVPMPPPAVGPAVGLITSVASGLHLLVTVPALRSVTVATTVSFTALGGLPVVFPLLAVELGRSAAAGGALFSAFALGALGGSLAWPPARRGRARCGSLSPASPVSPSPSPLSRWHPPCWWPSPWRPSPERSRGRCSPAR
jgi:hypothetical protein